MEFLIIFLKLFFIISIFSFFSIAPWVPTKKNDLNKIKKIADLKPNEKFLEIWCWTALVSIYMAKNNPKSYITWIELSIFFYLIAKIKVFFSWQKNIKIFFWNALKENFWNYDVIYVFWMPNTLQNLLLRKLNLELKNNSKFISYCFKMNNNIFKEKKIKQNNKNSIYLYTLN